VHCTLDAARAGCCVSCASANTAAGALLHHQMRTKCILPCAHGMQALAKFAFYPDLRFFAAGADEDESADNDASAIARAPSKVSLPPMNPLA